MEKMHSRIENNKNKKLYITALNLYFICLPLNTINLGLGSILKFIAIIPVGIALLNAKWKIRVCKFFSFQILFSFFATMSIIWSVNIQMSIDRCVSYWLLTVLLLSGTFYSYDSTDIDRIKTGLLWSSRSTGIVMLLFSDFTQGRFLLRGIIKEDPNYLCGYLMAGTVITVAELLTPRKKGSRAIIELIIYIFLLIGTGSRGGLIAVAVAVVSLIIASKSDILSFKKKMFVIVTIAGFIVLINVFLPKQLLARFSFSNVIASQGTGRFDIWEKGIEVYKDLGVFNKIFGIGTGTITTVLRVFQYHVFHNYVMHNIFLETLVELGIIGILIYIINIFKFVSTSHKLDDKFSYCVLLSMIALSMSTSLHTFKPQFNILLFIIISSRKTLTE